MSEASDPHPTDCWGCRAEAAIDGSLGERCRDQLTRRRTDPSTPKLNDMIQRLEGAYDRLCWNCQTELAVGIGGLCPMCESELRR